MTIHGNPEIMIAAQIKVLWQADFGYDLPEDVPYIEAAYKLAVTHYEGDIIRMAAVAASNFCEIGFLEELPGATGSGSHNWSRLTDVLSKCENCSVVTHNDQGTSQDVEDYLTGY